MHDDTKNDSTGRPEGDAEKKLAEALLAEYVRAGADADEAFVASVENAIGETAEPVDPATFPGIEDVTSLPVSSRKPSTARAKTVAWSVAVLVHVGIILVLGSIYFAPTPVEPPAEIVAIAAPSTEVEANALYKSLTNPVADASKVRVLPPQPLAPRAKPGSAAPGANPHAVNANDFRPFSMPLLASAAPENETDAILFGHPVSGPTDAIADFGVGIGFSVDASGEMVERKKDLELHGWNAPPVDQERYGELIDNRWQAPDNYPLSTFSVDVDTASYTNLRRMIRDRVAIPKDSVRIEEMINYFDYDYPEAAGEHPFAFAIETASCPWNEAHRLVRVGLKGKSIARDRRPAANLVFLLDVSGSMNEPRKLPLVVESMKILVEELHSDDVVSIVVYAGAEGLALPPTRGSEKKKILGALDRLKAGGSTNGGAGIQLAYKMATENFIEEGVNRVILCTDGDFNVGRTVQGDLVDMVKERAQGGTFLSVLGFGTGNINDSMLESITNKGNGTYYYVDSIAEGRKVFLEDLMATLVTIAKDVKIQVEFNPAKVEGYRLIGYANRMLEAEDFEDDTVDAGEVGAGHRVTALYEIIPAGLEENFIQPLPELKYRKARKTRAVPSEDLLTVKLRYKEPAGDVSKLLEVPVVDGGQSWKRASDDFQFASAVALFGMILRDSQHIGDATLVRVIEVAAFAKGDRDPHQRREEFRELVSLKIAKPR